MSCSALRVLVISSLVVVVIVTLSAILRNVIVLRKEHFENTTAPYVVKMDAFPCKVVGSDKSGDTMGCYYNAVGGCVMNASQDGVCPSTAPAITSEPTPVTLNPAPVASNTTIFEYVYNALKNTPPNTTCPTQATCPSDFFDRVKKLSTNEIQALVQTATIDPCSSAAACVASPVISAYIDQLDRV